MAFRAPDSWLRLPACLALALATSLAVAGSAGASTQDDLSAKDREVEVTLYVVDILDIDSAQQWVVLDFILLARWHDASLAADTDESRVLSADGNWTPRFQVTSGKGLHTSMSEVLEVDPDGNVTYRQRYSGTISSRMHLAKFPFDHHTVELRIAAAAFRPITFVPNHAASGLSESLTVADWDVEPGGVSLEPFRAAGRVVPSFAYEFEVHRHTGYYVWKVMLPLVLIVFMSWIVFWIDPSEFGPQLATATASMLTLIAYRFALDSLLPKISYFTRMDTFVTGSTLLVFLALVQAVITSRIARRPDPTRAVRIERTSRFLFPALFVALVFYSFAL
jgi:hypothetical protein